MAVSRAFLPPLVLATLAAGVTAAAFLVPGHPRPVSRVIDLSANATSELAFRTDADGGYRAELEMDQPTARRLYPCVADPSTLGSEPCDGPSMPLDLAVSVAGKKGLVVQARYAADGERGGSFDGKTFAILMTAGQLEPRTDYRLVVRSLRDGSALAPARPRLAVDVAPGARALEVAKRILAVLAAAALVVIALIWAAIVVVLRPRRARR